MHNNYYLRSIFLTNGIFVFASMSLAPLFAIYLEGFGVDFFQIGLTSTIFMVSTAFFLILMYMFGDYIPKKARLLPIAYIIRAGVWTGYFFATSIEQIFILQAIAGLGEAIGSTVYDVIVAEHLDDGHHVENYSSSRLIVSMAAGLAAVTGGFIVENYGFRTLFVFMVCLSLVAVLMFIQFRINYHKQKMAALTQEDKSNNIDLISKDEEKKDVDEDNLVSEGIEGDIQGIPEKAK